MARADSMGRMATVLVTGATGFIGRRLVPALIDAGHDVRAMTRHPETYDGPGEAVGADVMDPDSLRPALDGVDVAIYLVHSLDDPDFERKDAQAARNFSAAAAAAGVQQIVYMGGLGDDDQDLSAHLRSRREVEGLLGDGRRAGHGAARRDRGRPRWHLVGDHPPAGEEPAGDGGAQVGRHPHPADRPRRRGPLPRRRRRPGGGARPGLRDRRHRAADLPRDDAGRRASR